MYQKDTKDTTKANALFSQYKNRKTTLRWGAGDGDYKTLSQSKMEANINFKHPRLIKTGKDGDENNIQFQQYPLCTPIGNLFYEKEIIEANDNEEEG